MYSILYIPINIYFHKKIDIKYLSFVAYCVVLPFEGLGGEESVKNIGWEGRMNGGGVEILFSHFMVDRYIL